MRAISRITGVSINTVSKLLVDAGLVCASFHDEQGRKVRVERVQCDEILVVLLRQAKERKERQGAP